MSQLPRYESYKGSGVQWLGEIPSHWDVKRMKFVVTNVGDKIDAKESDLRYFGLENIESFTGKLLDSVELESEGVGHRFQKDDVLFGKLRPYLAKVFLAQEEGLSSTEALVFRSSEVIYPKFLSYYCLSQDFINEVNGTTFGSKMPRASWDDISSFRMVYPSLDEQKIIADFLDKRIAQVDALIAKQETLLEKLAEQRVALISHAVTKGLNPDVEMKESGVSWFNQIPKSWDVKKLKFVITKIQTGSTPPSAVTEYYSSDDIVWYGPADFLDENYILSGSVKKISALALEDKVVKPVLKGSIMMIGIGATLGKVAITNVDCTTNQQINSLIPIEGFSAKYLMYQLNSLRDIVKLLSSASTLGIINQEKTKCLKIIVPSLNDQNEIVEFLDKELNEISEVKKSVEQTINKLKEYRSTLITQVVTGKIDVRNLKVN